MKPKHRIEFLAIGVFCLLAAVVFMLSSCPAAEPFGDDPPAWGEPIGDRNP